VRGAHAPLGRTCERHAGGRDLTPTGLADLLLEARLEVISDSRTYLPEDQPEKLVQLIRDFARTRTQRSDAP
jgi:hypothetical protein